MNDARHLDDNRHCRGDLHQNTPWEHMPFFLVTQTSLVEAQDEQEAVQKGVDSLRSGGQVTVAVKSDETTITHVVVAAVVEEPLSISPSEAVNPFPSSVAIPEAGLPHRETGKLP